MPKVILSLLITFFIQSASAAAPNPSLYLYEKSLSAGTISQATQIAVPLDPEVTNQVDMDFSNIQIIDQDNNEVPFTLFDVPAEKVKFIETLQASSQKEGDPHNIFDNNLLTEYSFDERVDGKGDSWVWLDLGTPRSIHQIKVYKTENAKIREFEISTGNQPKDLKKAITRKPFEPIINLNTKPQRYLKISLWGISVKLQELRLYAKKSGTLYFEAQPGQKYKLLYGNSEINSKRYKNRISAPITDIANEAIVGSQRFNQLLANDVDDDGIENQEDNCPLISNKNQKDDDNDRIGNVCDNAPEVKNYDQSDVDEDTIGDIIDNCKSEPNPDQKDRDNDGVGNICDTAHGKEKVDFQEATTAVSGGLVGGIAAILALLGLGWFIRKKQQ